MDPLQAVQFATICTVLLSIVGFIKALQYLYELFFKKPRLEIEAKMIKMKDEQDRAIDEFATRLKQVEDYRIESAVRHEQANRAIERLDEKIDHISQKLDLLVDLVKKR